MPENLADFIIAVLRVVNAMFSIWVDLGANQPLTNDGSFLVTNLADAAVAIVNTVAQLFLNNPV